MRWSKSLIPTLKEVPQEAEAISHQLMLRAGLIRKLASGTYSYLPLGFKVIKKVERIIREEMDKSGAQEVLLPALQPVELWMESGRYSDLGEDMVSFKDRHGKEVVLGPTHEEVITDLIRKEVKSYRQLPIILYQLQTKFRDEIRPRFGVIRSKEFIMKDAYSFDRDIEGLNSSYEKMYKAYCRIFERCGLSYIIVEADPGIMGGNVSHEFMVLARNGEDEIVNCPSCGYAASLAKAECPEVAPRPKTSLKPLKEVSTPDSKTIGEVSKLLDVTPDAMVKTLIYEADERPYAILVRGDHEVNEAKVTRLLKCSRLTLANERTIEQATGAPMGFAGPVGLKGVQIIADYSIRDINDFVTGANKKDMHLVNVNIDRDFKVDLWGDIRYIRDTDPCPRCGKGLRIEHAIEIGHIFKLGTKYSKSLGARFLDEDGKEKDIIMGCYGIGVNRIVASIIEEHHDEDGIIWPISISPFEVLILPVNPTHAESTEFAEEVYTSLLDDGIDTLLDDRDERPGIKFKDADLIGIPFRIVIGEKNLKMGKVEIKNRKTKEVITIPKEDVVSTIKDLLKKQKEIYAKGKI